MSTPKDRFLIIIAVLIVVVLVSTIVISGAQHTSNVTISNGSSIDGNNTSIVSSFNVSKPGLVEQIMENDARVASASLWQKKLDSNLRGLVNSSMLIPGQTQEDIKNNLTRIGVYIRSQDLNNTNGKAADDIVLVRVWLKQISSPTLIEPYLWNTTPSLDSTGNPYEDISYAEGWIEVRNLEPFASLDNVGSIKIIMPSTTN